MESKLLEIINHYGVMPQLKYFQSEVFELNEAIIKMEMEIDAYEPKLGYKDHQEYIAEEIADVLVMLKQFQHYYNINREDIRKIMNEKIDRQLERMKEEK